MRTPAAILGQDILLLKSLVASIGVGVIVPFPFANNFLKPEKSHKYKSDFFVVHKSQLKFGANRKNHFLKIASTALLVCFHKTHRELLELQQSSLRLSRPIFGAILSSKT